MKIQEKINALMEQEAFAQAFQQVTTPEEVAELFGRHGVEVPLEIAKELFEDPQGELDLEDLDNVSGGGPVGSTAGGALGNGIFFGAGYLGARLAGWSKSKSYKYAQKCGYAGSALGGLLGGLVIPV